MLFAAAIAVPMQWPLPPQIAAMLPMMPWAVMAAALLLSQIYQQGRMGFVVLLSMGNFGVASYLQQALGGSNINADVQLGYWLWGLTAPLLLLLFALLPSRLVFHPRAWGHWLLLLTVVFAAGLLWQQSALLAPLSPWLQTRQLPLFSWSPAPLLLLALQLIVTLICWIRYLQTKSHDGVAVALAQVALLLSSLWIGEAQQLALLATCLASAQLLLVLGLGHQLAFIDELTAIPGRRALNMALARLGRRYTLAMLDIDHFKKFNDTHGHDVGDEVLQMVAQRLTLVTHGGKVYRYGGEEFTVLFSGKQPAQVKAALEAVRQDIADYPFVVRSAKRKGADLQQGRGQRGEGGGKTVQVTISLGVANRTSNRTDTDAVLKAADKALYVAKKAGRNCLRIAPKAQD